MGDVLVKTDVLAKMDANPLPISPSVDTFLVA
jgi:hypothetical protein